MTTWLPAFLVLNDLGFKLLCKKRDISKYRLSQLSGISQSSLGRIMAQESLIRRVRVYY